LFPAALNSDDLPDNGLQIVMFTHQDAGVWADMAAIVWGAGLQVTAAWYIATETSSELKKGGYVQGAVLLVLGNDCITRAFTVTNWCRRCAQRSPARSRL
jgi:hypothetical protein